MKSKYSMDVVFKHECGFNNDPDDYLGGTSTTTEYTQAIINNL